MTDSDVDRRLRATVEAYPVPPLLDATLVRARRSMRPRRSPMRRTMLTVLVTLVLPSLAFATPAIRTPLYQGLAASLQHAGAPVSGVAQVVPVVGSRAEAAGLPLVISRSFRLHEAFETTSIPRSYVAVYNQGSRLLHVTVVPLGARSGTMLVVGNEHAFSTLHLKTVRTHANEVTFAADSDIPQAELDGIARHDAEHFVIAAGR